MITCHILKILHLKIRNFSFILDYTFLCYDSFLENNIKRIGKSRCFNFDSSLILKLLSQKLDF
ncbi:hypothetical protein BpHYR1_022865 [Brachionus plicatilis]|uniref:Uncharacterized protein n=1 Tax=Brachionus plicatilis TaxID=10195 RepID=A0A3M7RAB2_BRAPC|nr:hypothetical protein BpHYR1_022865 [Brachionus plicatilis]